MSAPSADAKAEPARDCRPAGSPYAQAEVSERPQPRPRGGNRCIALTGLDALARLHSRLHDSWPARRGVAPAAAWTVADALSVAGVAAGAAWAPRIDAAARSLQPARVRHHPADVLAFTEVAAAWLAKARAVLAERHRRRGARRAGGAGQSSVVPSPALPSVAAFRGVAAPPVVAPTPPEVGAPAGHPGSQASRARYPPPPTRPSPAGDGVGWGAVDHLSDVDMVHMPAEMSMETAVPIDFQEAWAEAQRRVNERVVAAMEANDPVVLDRALKWKYLLPQLLLRAPSRGGRRRLQALAWRFRAFAERRMTELVRSWDDARTEAFYAGHARQRRTDADLFAALLVGTADTVVALVEDGELSRAAGRLSSKGMGDLSDPAILAQLRDKHPSRSHPIPGATYAIPVDEAALAVDMRVPYQQLKQHVAAGPSGMRNEYLRCLVGEYAPASGPAAVRAMSEVASMYLQGRLPGWFNRLFASARLVAPVKKLGEGRAPDVRPVAVGEAERRAAERAVVDNMKEAYVSVLAPSQLGVGIPAGDSVLIHGVRLIAEKLGPPSLSTDSYLVVDGVQQGAPLATTSFCVANHPEVQQCDTTLEVNDGAARFNADDEILVGLPKHVWPALHAFRTSIKASVGLEVRFDKMQAYCADMEAARREAPTDIEWPALDGHHGIAVLNVPLGSPEYVQTYIRGKAEELREEVDASLSKLLSAKPSRRYTHALHHHAWALLKHCMQHKAGYWLRNCLPSEVEAFAEAVDATILAAVERVLGVSFDPSTYGTDTNPVVTDFLAELLHDPDPKAAEVATLSEDAVARARSRLHLPTRLKGAGIRRMATVRDAAFIGCMNAILPRFLTRNSGTNHCMPAKGWIASVSKNGVYTCKHCHGIVSEDDVMGVGEDPVGEDGVDIDAPAWPPADVEAADEGVIRKGDPGDFYMKVIAKKFRGVWHYGVITGVVTEWVLEDYGGATQWRAVFEDGSGKVTVQSGWVMEDCLNHMETFSILNAGPLFEEARVKAIMTENELRVPRRAAPMRVGWAGQRGAKARRPGQRGAKARRPGQRGAKARRPGQRGAKARRPRERGAKARRPGQRGAKARRPGQRGAKARRPGERGAKARRPGQRGAKARRPGQRGANASGMGGAAVATE
eukprot:jgi/Tetstr1/430175/TSEL_020006.t1